MTLTGLVATLTACPFLDDLLLLLEALDETLTGSFSSTTVAARTFSSRDTGVLVPLEDVGPISLLKENSFSFAEIITLTILFWS